MADNTLDFAIEGDASQLTSTLDKVIDSVDTFVDKVDKLNQVNFGSSIESEAKAVQSALIDAGTGAGTLSDQLSSISSPNINTDPINNLTTAINGADTATADLRSELSTPFVITLGDVTGALDDLSNKIGAAESKFAGFNKAAAGVSLISGINEKAMKDMAIAVSDEDMSIQGAYDSANILAKQHVTSEAQMKSSLEAWKAFGNANDEQAATLQEKLIPAWNQFGISVEDQSKYMDGLTTLFQTTNMGSGDFSSAIAKNGKDLSEMGLSLEQVETLFLSMEESGYTGRKGASALSGAITDINAAAKEAGGEVPKGADAFKALVDTIGISSDKVSSASEKIEKSSGAVGKWSEAMDKGDTATEKFQAKVEKLTAGFSDLVTPLAPAAVGISGIAAAGANLAIFDKFLAGGAISSGLEGLVSKLPLIGTTAAEGAGGVGLLEGSLAALGPAGIIAAGAAVVIGTAYATNFGGFADNINTALEESGEALKEFGEGDYEDAGKKAAESIADGFGALGDLLGDVVQALPELAVDAEKLLSGLNEGLKEAARGAGEGFRAALESFLASAQVKVDAFCTAIANAVKNFSWADTSKSIVDMISKGIDGATANVSGFKSTLESALKGDESSWKSIGYSIGDWVVSGVNATMGPGAGAAAALAKEALMGAVGSTPGTTGKSASTPQIPGHTIREIGPVQSSGSPSYDGWTIAAPTKVTVNISPKDVTLADVKAYKASSDGGKWDSHQLSTLDKVPISDGMREAAANWKNRLNAQSTASAGAASATNAGTKATEKYTTYTGKLEDAAEQAIAANQKTFINNGKIYEIDVQTGEAKSTALEDQINANKQAAADKELKAQQADAEKERTAAEKESAAALKREADVAAAFAAKKQKYSDTLGENERKLQKAISEVKPGEGASDSISKLKGDYEFNKNELRIKAAAEGIDLDNLNATMVESGGVAKALQKTYSDTNTALIKSIGDLEKEKNEKLQKNPKADTTAIDKKLAEQKAALAENEKLLSGATSAIKTYSDAVSKSGIIARNAAGDLSVTPYTGKSSGFGAASAVATPSVEQMRSMYADAYGATTSGMPDEYIAELFQKNIADIASRLYSGSMPSLQNHNYEQFLPNTEVSESTQSIKSALSDFLAAGTDDYAKAKTLWDTLNTSVGENNEFTASAAIKTSKLADAYKSSSDLLDTYVKATSDSKFSQEEQNDVSEKYNQVLKDLQSQGLDTTEGISGLSPALKKLFDEIKGIIDGVSGDASKAGVDISKTPEKKASLSSGDSLSDKTFAGIQNKFADLKSQFDSGGISLETYLQGLRQASADTDTLSRSTNTLTGEQKNAVLSFENNIKESLRRIEAGTYGDKPVKAIGDSIDGLTSTSKRATDGSQQLDMSWRDTADASKLAQYGSQLHANAATDVGSKSTTAAGQIALTASAIQNLTNSATASYNQIRSALAAANAAVASANQYINSVKSYVGKYQPDPTVPVSRLSADSASKIATITQNINFSNSKFTADYKPKIVISDAFDAITARG